MSFQGSKILVTGATGFIGRNLILKLKEMDYSNVIGVSSKDYDLMKQDQVQKMFQEHKPEVVIHLAAYVGGILANKKFPADFIYKNLMINTQVINEASKNPKLKKFITCIGGCSYPNTAESPIKEECIFNGMPAEESAPYSLAKAMSWLQVKAYRKQYNFPGIVLVPGNVYGPYDNFDLENSHVIPGLIRKIVEAKMNMQENFVAWGSGKPVRDFVYIEDAAEGIIKAIEEYDDDQLINISSGEGTTIKELIELIVQITGFKGQLVWDTEKPDGKAHKVFDVTRMQDVLGFKCKTDLKEGLKKTITWFEENYKKGIVRLKE